MTSAPIPNTFTNLAPTNLTQDVPEVATVKGCPTAEAVIYQGIAAGSNNPPTFSLSGLGGPKGKYRIQVRAQFNGGSLTLAGPSGFRQTWTAIETVDVPLAAGTYSWSWTGAPTACLLSIGAL